MWVIFDHLRPSGHIMPDHAGDRGAAWMVLAPHDHLHIKQMRTSGEEPWVLAALVMQRWFGPVAGQRNASTCHGRWPPEWGPATRCVRQPGRKLAVSDDP